MVKPLQEKAHLNYKTQRRIAKGIQLKKIDSDKYQRFIDREDYSRIVRLFQDGKLQLGTENLEDPIKVVIALAIYRLHFPNLKQ